MANQITIQPGQTLGGLASQYGTTVQNLQALNPNITNPNLIIAGQSLNIPTLNGSPVVDTNILGGNATPLQVPPSTQGEIIPATSGLNNAPLNLPSVTANSQVQGQSLTAAQRRLLEYSTQLEGQGAVQQQLEQQAGLADKQKQIDQQTLSLTEMNNQFNKRAANYLNGQVGGQELAQGLNERERRQQAVEISSQSAVLNVLQGNLAQAKSDVDHALKLQFDPIKQKIENTRLFIDMNYQNFDRAEKREADALRIKLDQQNKAIDRAIRAREFNTNLAVTLAKDGKISNSDLENVINGKTSVFKLSTLAAGQGSGVPSETAEKIGESKVGQKVNASIDFAKSVGEYKTLYKKYNDAGQLLSVKARQDLDVLRGDLEQKYSVANGQGAVQTGDRESYKKIISGGVFFPKIVLNNMDTLINSVTSTVKNDIGYLDRTYNNFGTPFFANQLTTAQANANATPATATGSTFWNLVGSTASPTSSISNIYNPQTGFNIPNQPTQ